MPDNKLPKSSEIFCYQVPKQKKKPNGSRLLKRRQKEAGPASLLKFPSFGVGVDGVSSPDTHCKRMRPLPFSVCRPTCD
ncbi:hypothetical protein CDAR_376191 [Caerostris darwini]|uniref:Uncharacterized protein n=1 Tax=Caerostris darwini TaxID=1538125 RepID=A0AAV4SCV7_9ARAC|nr:hypothetical protein CDAR_376191 [Caerostris darwini]